MKQSKTFFEDSGNSSSLVKGILIGTGIGLLMILIFITGAETESNWPELWKMRPLMITPLDGAFGGAFFYISKIRLREEGLNAYLASILSLFGFYHCVVAVHGTWAGRYFIGLKNMRTKSKFQ